MRVYKFKLVPQVCRGCGIEFQRHSNAKYCNSKCQEKKSMWALRRAEKRISNLEFFLKQKINLAIQRNKYQVTVTYPELKAQWDKQEGLCALSHIPMTYLKGSGRVPTNVSLDRIDSAGDYTADNIQLVCYQANLMKAELTHRQLLYWVDAILNAEKKRLQKRVPIVSLKAGADQEPLGAEPSQENPSQSGSGS